jgi:hypothetical protein
MFYYLPFEKLPSKTGKTFCHDKKMPVESEKKVFYILLVGGTLKYFLRSHHTVSGER